MVLQVAKYFPICHVPSFYNKLHLVDARLHQQKRFSQADTILTWFNIFAFSCLQTEESSQSIYIQQINSARCIHSARCTTQDLCNTDTSDMNNTQSPSLPALSPWVFLALS